MAYEDELWGQIYESLETLSSSLDANLDPDFMTDLSSEVRDLILERVQKETNIEIVDVYDEY